MEVMVFPMMGIGVFGASTLAGLIMVAAPFMLHLIYGSILGALTGARANSTANDWSATAHPLAH